MPGQNDRCRRPHIGTQGNEIAEKLVKTTSKSNNIMDFSVDKLNVNVYIIKSNIEKEEERT